MSMISEQINGLRKLAKTLEEGGWNVDVLQLVNELRCSADTIEELSAKLASANMERSTAYYNDGWIPCSERLPEVYGDTKSSDVVLVCGYDEESDYNWQAMGFYVKTEAIKRWFFAECKDTDKPIDWIDIVAWQPLPAPYKPKGEK